MKNSKSYLSFLKMLLLLLLLYFRTCLESSLPVTPYLATPAVTPILRPAPPPPPPFPSLRRSLPCGSTPPPSFPSVGPPASSADRPEEHTKKKKSFTAVLLLYCCILVSLIAVSMSLCMSHVPCPRLLSSIGGG